jgi:hypothetical protein
MLVTGLGVTDDERLEYLVEQARLSCEDKKLQFMRRSACFSFPGSFWLRSMQVPGWYLCSIICGLLAVSFRRRTLYAHPATADPLVVSIQSTAPSFYVKVFSLETPTWKTQCFTK